MTIGGGTGTKGGVAENSSAHTKKPYKFNKRFSMKPVNKRFSMKPSYKRFSMKVIIRDLSSKVPHKRFRTKESLVQNPK